MQRIKSAILSHVRVQASLRECSLPGNANLLSKYTRQLCTSVSNNADEIMGRVIGLVKKFDKTDAAKVTETADFQKDLSLDSLDKVELVMAFEQEFSIEIPDQEADKFTCCADVAKYIRDETEQQAAEKS